jgi:hypothetical protein
MPTADKYLQPELQRHHPNNGNIIRCSRTHATELGYAFAKQTFFFLIIFVILLVRDKISKGLHKIKLRF